MALESGTYINSLNASNPASTDGLGQADDHLRLIKSTIKSTFPNVDAAVNATPAELNVLDGFTGSTADLNKLDGLTATQAELNYVDGVTSALQTQLDGKASTTSPTISNPTLTGTTTVTAISLGAFTIEEGTDGRLDFKVTSSGTTIMSLTPSGHLRLLDDVTGFDTTT